MPGATMNCGQWFYIVHVFSNDSYVGLAVLRKKPQYDFVHSTWWQIITLFVQTTEPKESPQQLFAMLCGPLVFCQSSRRLPMVFNKRNWQDGGFDGYKGCRVMISLKLLTFIHITPKVIELQKSPTPHTSTEASVSSSRWMAVSSFSPSPTASFDERVARNAGWTKRHKLGKIRCVANKNRDLTTKN